MAGATGRLGEALLAEVISSGRYQRVIVLPAATQALRSTDIARAALAVMADSAAAGLSTVPLETIRKYAATPSTRT